MATIAIYTQNHIKHNMTLDYNVTTIQFSPPFFAKPKKDYQNSVTDFTKKPHNDTTQ